LAPLGGINSVAVEEAVLRLENGRAAEGKDAVTEEVPLTIYLNQEEVATLLCSPGHWDELAVGFLVAQGLVRQPEEIARVEVEAQRGLAWVQTTVSRPLAKQGMFKRLLTSGCGGGVSFSFANEASGLAPVMAECRVAAAAIPELMHRFQRMSEAFRETGGVHSAALASEEEILVFREDIGRHNAVDKVNGHCFLHRIPVKDKLLLTTGRLSSEILTKVARLGIPFLVSRSAPTSLAVAYARELGITLIGFARGRRFTAYTHPERLRWE